MERTYVDTYVRTHNKTEAAREAGYSDPNSQGSRIFKKSHIQAAIKERMEDDTALIGITPQWVLSELVDQLQVLKAKVAPLVQSRSKKPITDDEGNPVYTRKEADITAVLKLIGQALGMFKDTVEVRTDTASDYRTKMDEVSKLALIYDRDRDAA